MTNAEKYKEVFGFFPDLECCPTKNCSECPSYAYNPNCNNSWWLEEYKGVYNNDVSKE